MSKLDSAEKSRHWRPFQISLVLHVVGLVAWLFIFGLLALSYSSSDAPGTFTMVRNYPVVAVILHAISFFLIRSKRRPLGNGLLLLPLLWGCGMLFSFVGLAMQP